MTLPAQQALLPVDGDIFRKAMSRLAAPLTVVTTRDETGTPRGFTASSVTAASLEPPLVVVGIAHTSSCFGVLSRAPEFVANVLDRQHRAVAERFARSGVDRFAGQDFASWPGSGLPCLPGAHAALRCVVRERIPVGDHDLLIGELVGVLTSESTEPLLWYDRAFRTLAAAL
ncbi:flavin reductase family protein [Streptomyces olivaceoviridis]|uniref:flavin reductase family protein n=1 Tax=Streptomyces olivaceoviridis TaxID=1921 RepID=UPI0036F9D2B1